MELQGGHLLLVPASYTSGAEGKRVALPVSRHLCCFVVRAIFEMEEPDGALPTDNRRKAIAD